MEMLARQILNEESGIKDEELVPNEAKVLTFFEDGKRLDNSCYNFST